VDVKGYSWVGVGTDDFDGTLSFFSTIMGLSPVVVEERGVAILKVSDGQVLEVFGPGTQGRQLTFPPIVAFEVEDVAAAREELLLHEVEVLGEIGSWNGFEWLKFRGPDGHIFAVQKTPPTGWEETS
jgi:catechol 2,3-dioxygenase-like lactoylglutathione lyase family enzyme